MKNAIISVVLIVGFLIATYNPPNYSQVILFNNDTAISIGVKDQWYEIDGFTDANFNLIGSDFVQDPNGKGVIPLVSGLYLASYYFNYRKEAGANNVQFEICATENGTCYAGTKIKITAISANQFQTGSVSFYIPLSAGQVYGQAVRNTTNTDNPVFFSFSQLYARVK